MGSKPEPENQQKKTKEQKAIRYFGFSTRNSSLSEHCKLVQRRVNIAPGAFVCFVFLCKKCMNWVEAGVVWQVERSQESGA
jgi:hypothetical protein